MKYTLYKLTNTADNGKSYIGQTTNPKMRWNRCQYRGIRIKAAIEKFGWNNFKHEILAVVDDPDIADKLEIGFISGFKTQNPDFGYNTQHGGSYSRKGYKRSVKATKKQRATMQRIKWYYNPKTNETIRLLPEAEVPEGFVPGRGNFKPTKPFGHSN